MLAAIGDREIGDNDWPSGPRTDFVPAMKEAFGTHMVDPLGIASFWNGVSAFAPGGDGQYDEGSYVYQNKKVLFLTVDVFKFSAIVPADAAAGIYNRSLPPTALRTRSLFC